MNDILKLLIIYALTLSWIAGIVVVGLATGNWILTGAIVFAGALGLFIVNTKIAKHST